MSSIASLPWYDLPSTHNNIDQFWQILASALRECGVTQVPEQLNRSTALELQWASPKLLISQCCGPDLFTPAATQLEVIARPVFDDLNCDDGHYFSHIVINPQYNYGPAHLVVNSLSSRSGHGALVEWCKLQGITTARLTVSGSHHQSLAVLRDGQADIAAIDAHSWNLLQETELTIVGRSTEALTPPYVMHMEHSAKREQVRDALQHAVEAAGYRVGIKAILPADKHAYQTTVIDHQLAPVELLEKVPAR